MNYFVRCVLKYNIGHTKLPFRVTEWFYTQTDLCFIQNLDIFLLKKNNQIPREKLRNSFEEFVGSSTFEYYENL